MRVLLLGGRGGTALGDSFDRAMTRLGHDSRLLDTASAYGRGVMQSLLWRVADRRPAHRPAFEQRFLAATEEFAPDLVVAAGLPPVSAAVLQRVSRAGIETACFLSDDPWNAAHRSRWGLAALAHFGRVYTPRTANVAQLEAIMPGRVTRLPFGYDDELFHPVPNDPGLSSDVLFVGTCDEDRLPFFRALRSSDVRLRVYGRYYDRWPETRGVSDGQADAATLRAATCSAKVNLCLVRHGNHDGHVMRTFEMAACGACMLVEGTDEHRALLGPDGECVRYFHTPDEMSDRLRELLRDDAQRRELGSRVLERIAQGRHTYVDRVRTMLGERAAA